MRFSRFLKAFERVFPPGGTEFIQVGERSDDIQLTHEPFSRFVTAEGLLRTFTVTQNTGGTLTFTLEEPRAGIIQIPLLVSYGNGDAASRLATTFIGPTATTPDPWGTWNATSAQRLDDRWCETLCSVQLGALPIPRGNQLNVAVLATTAANNHTVTFYWVDMPGELVTLDQILKCAQIRGNMSRSRAI